MASLGERFRASVQTLQEAVFTAFSPRRVSLPSPEEAILEDFTAFAGDQTAVMGDWLRALEKMQQELAEQNGASTQPPQPTRRPQGQ